MLSLESLSLHAVLLVKLKCLQSLSALFAVYMYGLSLGGVGIYFPEPHLAYLSNPLLASPASGKLEDRRAWPRAEMFQNAPSWTRKRKRKFL
jgi:hypothetical protein